MSDQVSLNKRRSLLLLGGAFAVAAVVASLLALVAGSGWIGVAVAVVVAAAGAGVAWWASDRVVLAVSRAEPAEPAEYARLHNLVEGLCVASGLPKPGIYVIDDAAPNAFATGRSHHHAAIAVTTGLLAVLNRVELEGVLAHELGRIKSDDATVDTLAVTCVAPMVLLADMCIRTRWWNGGRLGRDDPAPSTGPKATLAYLGIGLLTVSPPVARLLRAVVSPHRSPMADISAIAMTRYPPALTSALAKLRDDTTVAHASTRATAHLWIESPIARVDSEGHLVRFNRLFDTHPPLDERISALQEL